MNQHHARCDICEQPAVTMTVIDWLAPKGEQVCVQCLPKIRAQMDTRWESDRLTHREQWRMRLHLPAAIVER